MHYLPPRQGQYRRMEHETRELAESRHEVELREAWHLLAFLFWLPSAWPLCDYYDSRLDQRCSVYRSNQPSPTAVQPTRYGRSSSSLGTITTSALRAR